MTLAWDVLNELDAYRITEIPRRSDADVTQPAQDQLNDAAKVAQLIQDTNDTLKD